MYRNRQFSIFPIGVCITDQFDKYEGHKQGRKKIKSAVLIRSDAEVCTFFFSRQRQVDLIIGSDLADQLVLEYLKSGTESDDDAGTYRVTCLLSVYQDSDPEKLHCNNFDYDPNSITSEKIEENINKRRR